jgi:hypothetical protein
MIGKAISHYPTLEKLGGGGRVQVGLVSRLKDPGFRGFQPAAAELNLVAF